MARKLVMDQTKADTALKEIMEVSRDMDNKTGIMVRTVNSRVGAVRRENKYSHQQAPFIYTGTIPTSEDTYDK
ncbi:hypothetical protein YQE_02755, partial [Dendroctonus ponderosae]